MQIKPWFLKALFAILVACSLRQAASAAILIGNYPETNDSIFSTIAATSGNLSKAAGFTLPAGINYHLDSITLRLDVNDASSSVTFSLFGDVGGSPGGAPLLSFTTRPLANGIGDYSLTPSTSFTLQNSNTYWIAATGVSPTTDGVTWLASDPGVTPSGIASSAGFRSDSSGAYPPTRVSTIQNTYQVIATSVPEPSTTMLSLLATSGFVALRRRRLR